MLLMTLTSLSVLESHRSVSVHSSSKEADSTLKLTYDGKVFSPDILQDVHAKVAIVTQCWIQVHLAPVAG